MNKYNKSMFEPSTSVITKKINAIAIPFLVGIPGTISRALLDWLIPDEDYF